MELKTDISLNDLRRFKFCPFCGDKSVLIYDGDYSGRMYCLNEECGEDIEFLILNEYKHRYPEHFKKWVDKL